MSAIYKIVCNVNDKIYVGSAMNFNKRFYQYKTYETRAEIPDTRAIGLAIRKHGFKSFQFEILEWVDGDRNNKSTFKKIILAREQYWIDYYRSYDKTIGYNVSKTAGSCLGIRLSDQHKNKLRETSLAWRDENVKLHSKIVYQIDMDTLKVIAEFPSGKVAAKIIGCSDVALGNACRKITSSCCGFYWCRKEEYDTCGFKPRAYNDGRAIHKHLFKESVKQLDVNGNLIKTWASMKQIAKELGYNLQSVTKCCRGQKKSELYHGFRWEFAS
jgi:group I intron endonuclease